MEDDELDALVEAGVSRDSSSRSVLPRHTQLLTNRKPMPMV